MNTDPKHCRIRIKIYKLDPDPDQFADVKPKCMEYEPILALYQRFEPFFEARIWIGIRIRVKSRIRIQKNLNPDPHQDDKSNQDPHPDPYQSDADPQHWLLPCPCFCVQLSICNRCSSEKTEITWQWGEGVRYGTEDSVPTVPVQYRCLHYISGERGPGFLYL